MSYNLSKSALFRMWSYPNYISVVNNKKIVQPNSVRSCEGYSFYTICKVRFLGIGTKPPAAPILPKTGPRVLGQNVSLWLTF